jgi:hypothetical protein
MENRIINYSSNWERFKDTTKQYDYKDPMQWLAAGTHMATQFFGADAIIKDTGRMMDGNKSNLEPYGNFLGRTIGNTREIIGDLFRLKPFSAVTKVINYVGDGIADTADMLAGVNRHKLASTLNY